MNLLNNEAKRNHFPCLKIMHTSVKNLLFAQKFVAKVDSTCNIYLLGQ